MKKLAAVLVFFSLIGAGFAQQASTPPDISINQLNFNLLNPPQKVNFGSAVNSGNPGPATYYYWVVSNYAIGNSTPAGPFVITNAPNTLGAGSGVTVSWRAASGAASYDLLRTSTSAMPVGACNCAVATGVAGSSTTDQSNTLNAYTVNTFDPSTVLWAITNESVSSGVSQITFRVGGIAKFSLASNGGAVTLPTPATAPAHQFFNALSGGGTFSSAQPASADISDGTGTGVVVRTASPAISNPTTTGTDSGTETMSGKTLTSPAISNPTTTGTDSGTETMSGKTLTSPAISNPTTTGTDSGVETLGSKTLTAPILTGTAPYNRLRANQGAAIVTGDVGSITNFGTTASVSAVSGTDSAGTISILSNGTGQVANGSFVLTFHDGTWTTAPVCVGNRAEGNGPNSAPVSTSTSATTLAFNFDGAAVAGITYIFNFICIGK